MKFLNFFKKLKSRSTTKIERVQKKTLKELVFIIEGNQYDQELKYLCQKELFKHNKKDILFEANEYWVNYLKENLKLIIINRTLPKSYFLKEQQIKRLIKKERSQQQQNARDFNLNSSMGGPAAW